MTGLAAFFGVRQEGKGGLGRQVVDVRVDLLDIEQHARQRRRKIQWRVGRIVGRQDQIVGECHRGEGRVQEGLVVDVGG